MSSHHGEAISWLVASSHSEGDDAWEIPGQKVLKPRRKKSYNIMKYTHKRLIKKSANFTYLLLIIHHLENVKGTK